MKITNKGTEPLWAFLGTENPFPPTNVTIQPGETVEMDQEVWDVLREEIAKSEEVFHLLAE